MKKILAALMVTTFAFCVGTAFALSVNCTIDEVDAETGKITMTCDEKDKVKELKAGDKLKAKKKKQEAVEGC